MEEVATEVAMKWKEEKGMSLAEIRAYDATRFQLEVLRDQIRKEDEALRNHDIVVVDRTIYDNLFYAILHHDDVKLLETYARMIIDRERKLSYDLTLYCDPLLTNRPKPGRLMEHFVISRLLPRTVSLYPIPPLPLRKRVGMALEIIESGGEDAC